MTITEKTHVNNRYLYVAVFISGMSTLAIELSASRLLGSTFGTSNLVWANVIGLMLLYLTVGYFIGGWLSDRSPHYTTMYRILVWAAFLNALTPLISKPILRIASQAVIGAEAGLAIGSFIAVLILFSAPVTLLGTISPFAIRLAVTSVAESGKIAGRIYAISTLGSLVGTFTPTLVFIPLLGTTRTFLLYSLILFAAGVLGLLLHQPRKSIYTLWMPVVILVLSFVLIGNPSRDAISDQFQIIHESESAYNYIQVQEDSNGYRYLFLNEGQGIHSQWHPDQFVYRRTWSFFLAAPYFNPPPYSPNDVESLAVIGLAAGTIPRQYHAVYGDEISMDGIEIDAEIMEVGAQFFEMNPVVIPNLRLFASDGRYQLNQMDETYSVIAIDAYRPPYIPWHLTTVEFFQEVQAKLSPDGVVAINVGRTSTDRRLVNAMASTLNQVFPSVHAMDVPQTFNTILVATQHPSSPENLEQNLMSLPANTSAILRDILQLGVESLVSVETDGQIFTDDHAPVETLVDSIVLNFLLEGDLEEIR